MLRKILIIFEFLILSLVIISCNKPGVSTGNVNLNNSSLQLSDSSINVNSNKNNNANSVSYKIIDNVYKKGDIEIKYPEIVDLSNNEIEKKINKILKSEALDYYLSIATDGLEMELDYEIMFQSENVLSVKYIGYRYGEGAAYPVDLLYTVNINLNDGNKYKLKDYIKINKYFITTFKKYKVKDPEINQASAAAYDDIIKSNTVDDLIKQFKNADNSRVQNSSDVYTYFTKDNLVISFSVANVNGDHTEIALSYKDIRDSINKDCTIWNDLPIIE